MVPPSLFRLSTRPDRYLCARCALRASTLSQGPPKRWIGTKFLAKQTAADHVWAKVAKEIKAGKKKSMLTTLEARGLVHNVTGSRDEVDRIMTDERVGAYVGIDPTAPSLHIGHMLPLMSLFWMYVHGYQAITLVGGATAKIGDPTGRLTTREDVHRSVRAENTIKIHYQLKKLWVNAEAYGLKHGYRWEWAWTRGLMNNNSWMNKLPIMEVLQVLGPGVRMGPMLAKETVKNKMSQGDGMSFAEFTYPLLQAWDWWHLYNTRGIRMQIGGSDQYGNITAGMDAVKHVAANHPHPDFPKKTKELPFGFTVPLLTTSSGAKFGKSAGNAIWLDKDMTSTFELYAYFLRTADVDVGRYLRLFTFIPLEEIDALVEAHMRDPSKRVAQHKLASEFVELVHGREEAKSAAQQHQLMFQKPQDSAIHTTIPDDDPVGVTALDLPQVNLNNSPKAQLKLPRSLIETKSIGKILYACGLAKSASEGHRLAVEQAVHIGGRPGIHKGPMVDGALSFARIKTWLPEETKKYLIEDRLLILKRGKHNIRIIEVVEDDEYERSGLHYPGKGPSLRAQHQAGDDAEGGQGLSAEELSAKHDPHEADQQEEDAESGLVESKAMYDNPGEIDEIDERPDFASPEERLEILKENLREEEDRRYMKLAQKAAPKGKFTGHKRPRDAPRDEDVAAWSAKWFGQSPRS